MTKRPKIRVSLKRKAWETVLRVLADDLDPMRHDTQQSFRLTLHAYDAVTNALAKE